MQCARLLRLGTGAAHCRHCGECLSGVRADDTIPIASWNIQNVSDRSRSDAELGIIGLVLFRYDFIALQEVLDEEVIARVRRILKQDFRVDYDIAVSPLSGPVRRVKYAALRARRHGHARALRGAADRLLGVACAMLEYQTVLNLALSRQAHAA